MSDRFRIAFVALLSLTVALLFLPGSVAQAGAPNCIGLDACEGNTGAVGAGGCIGDSACLENTGDIGKHSCLGLVACDGNSGSVDRNACQGDGSCFGNLGDVQKEGCVGHGACTLNEGAVGKSACAGVEACVQNTGTLAKLGCRGDLACRLSSATVGVDACRGESACARSSASSIGKESCVGTSACFLTGPNPIGKNACRGDRACFNNVGPIGDGECVGPPVGGAGVCERLQTSVDSNIVTITGGTIVNVEYIEGSLVVTQGQPFESALSISRSGTEWTITVLAGRQGSTLVANGFNKLTGGADHLFPTFTFGDLSPAQLNFYFGVNLSIWVSGTTYTTPLYLGQGHTGLDNNWWLGGAAITATSSNTPPCCLGVEVQAQLVVGGNSYTLAARGSNAFIIE